MEKVVLSLNLDKFNLSLSEGSYDTVTSRNACKSI